MYRHGLRRARVFCVFFVVVFAGPDGSDALLSYAVMARRGE